MEFTQVAFERYGNVVKAPSVRVTFRFGDIASTSALYFVFGVRKVGGTCRLVTEARRSTAITTPRASFETVTW